MDLLVEKTNGKRYYLSQFKVLVTTFEESAPKMVRSATQLDRRNGSIDFGGWHESKSISVEGYFKADDMDEEEKTRERLFSLFSDTNGYYVTQLKSESAPSFERPGQSEGDYYEQLTTYPSYKRFFVYSEGPELEFVGSHGGELLYKVSIKLSTLKLPYGESLPRDVTVVGGVIPYTGSVPCNQLEQQFVVQFTAKESGNSLRVTVGDTDFTYTGQIVDGDTFELAGFSYTKNWVNIVNATNKAYFTLQPDTANTVSSSLLGEVKILGLQNLYA